MEKRKQSIPFRLEHSTKADPVQVQLTRAEYKAVETAAEGLPLGTFMRELVTFVVEGGLKEAKAAAKASGLPLAAYLRLLVLAAIDHIPLAADIATGIKYVKARKEK